MNYNIISTGSSGNCIVIDDFLLLDCGITFKKLKPYYKELKLVFISHQHSDHLNKTCIKALARERPTLRFAVGKWLIPILMECGVQEQNIDEIESGKVYDYGICRISPVILYHDCENYGVRLFVNGEKAIYITDTYTVDGIIAKNYDWYFLESNYDDAELQERIRIKQERGEYCYEYRVPLCHLSKQQAEEFLNQNMGTNSRYELIHKHIDRNGV